MHILNDAFLTCQESDHPSVLSASAMHVSGMEEWDPQTEHGEAQRVALGKEGSL